jgi:hypothetical protein
VGSRVRQIAAALGAALGLLGCGAHEEPADRGDPLAMEHPAPGSATTADGLYRVTIAPEAGAIPLGPIHDWVIEVETADGEDFVPTRLAFDGGMPQHGHGFVTAPRVTRSLGPGRFLVEGVKFHMGGDWTLRVEVVGPAGPDVAVFRVRVEG